MAIKRMFWEKKLKELKILKEEKDKDWWGDYEWATGVGDNVTGQISILEQILEEVEGE